MSIKYNVTIEGRHGDLITRACWLENCESGGFIDYDGHGVPVNKDGKIVGERIKPSTRNTLPDEATHILWFNR